MLMLEPGGAVGDQAHKIALPMGIGLSEDLLQIAAGGALGDVIAHCGFSQGFAGDQVF